MNSLQFIKVTKVEPQISQLKDPTKSHKRSSNLTIFIKKEF